MKKYSITIISTGSEITGGKSQDTNSMWMANELAGLGIKVRNFLALPDDPEIIYDEIISLKDKSIQRKDEIAWFILTGGLGPTEDDYTVDVVLKILNKPSEIVEKARLKLESIYRARGRDLGDLLPAVLRQTRIPADSIPLDNKVGIAPGFISELAPNINLCCMPGVPPEMREMFTKRLLPKIRDSISPTKMYRAEKFIWNQGESLYQEKFVKNHPILQTGRVEWGVTAKRGYVKVTYLSPEESDLAKILSDLDKSFPDSCSDDIFSLMPKILIERNQKIAVAESCTGGWVGKLFTDLPGSSQYFISSLVTYDNIAKENILFVNSETLLKKGAVSPEVAIQMTNGLEKHFDVDYSLSITGIAGPDGGTDEKPVGLVYIATKKKGQAARVLEYRFPGNREIVREASAHNAMFQLFKEITQ
ncbi:MAG: nicotinamide-nucleotide amidohydrolase family protein [Leptospiraceae bacterium]|jgi:nicotinamide-nucleotide amidase|nr:nicotinamide-nucleotide amidohydrolase family protein [Leptospiraceae bacterium]MCZ8348069.1 nicotinamide-nucleotide amidohydrolase family protein [Leptospiraceae bacterium]